MFDSMLNSCISHFVNVCTTFFVILVLVLPYRSPRPLLAQLRQTLGLYRGPACIQGPACISTSSLRQADGNIVYFTETISSFVESLVIGLDWRSE